MRFTRETPGLLPLGLFQSYLSFLQWKLLLGIYLSFYAYDCTFQHLERMPKLNIVQSLSTIFYKVEYIFIVLSALSTMQVQSGGKIIKLITLFIVLGRHIIAHRCDSAQHTIIEYSGILF
jgi:hypothetical protein